MNMNGLKIEGINKVDVIEAPVSQSELKETKEDTSKDTLESAQQEAKETASKHVIKYVGSGEYIDSTGRKWRNGDEQIMSDEEYEPRVDLQFMVKYGSMTNTVVTV